MNTPAPEIPTDAIIQRVITEKTAYWQKTAPAVNHLCSSGERPRGVFLPIASKMLSFIPPDASVLDVGCGHGRMALPIAEAGHRVVATDVSAKMLELLDQAKGDLPIETRQADAHRLAASDGEFDVVVSYDFMPHFPDWPCLLAEKTRACKLGGRIIFAFNFSEHRQFATPFNGSRFEHPYSNDVRSSKPFWAECTIDTMLRESKKLGLKLSAIVPLKFLHDNVAFGGVLGSEDYRVFQVELARRIEADPAVAEFFGWLEDRLFQRLPFFAAYSSLLVFERVAATNRDEYDTPPRSGVATSVSACTVPAAEIERFLNVIPSETRVGERRLPLGSFRHKWDGQGHLVKISPFLDGATRDMAGNSYLAPGCDSHHPQFTELKTVA